MKIMFISDIHGIKTNLKLIKKKYDKFECEKLVVLSLLYVDGLNIYITHGDKYSERNCQNLKNLKGILVYGHEHRPYIYEQGKFVYINTGSISLPRGTEKASYTIYDNRKFTIYDVEGKIINSISI